VLAPPLRLSVTWAAWTLAAVNGKSDATKKSDKNTMRPQKERATCVVVFFNIMFELCTPAPPFEFCPDIAISGPTRKHNDFNI
jgi:hypothetical protein